MTLMKPMTISRREREKQETLRWLTGDFEVNFGKWPFKTPRVTAADVAAADRQIAREQRATKRPQAKRTKAAGINRTF